MNLNEKDTKKYILITLIIMFIGSVALAWYMSSNMHTDVSKERFRLTTIYKKIKDETYAYDKVKGKQIYMNLCMRCHKADGTGSGMYPPLLNSKSPIIADPAKIIAVMVHGLQGPIVRGDITYSGAMPGFKRIDTTDLTHVLNYVRTEFNKFEDIIPHILVIEAKIDTITRATPYIEADLMTTKN